ncbi:MAG: PaaI family thioesterase [Candidatus Zixiibacteriota bacterium]
MKEIIKYPNCFVCGERNAHGLKARFYQEEQSAVTEVVATDSHEGYRGIYHGGVLSALLDEVMVKAILAVDRYAVTAELTVRFRLPVFVGDRLRCVGRIVRHKGRMYLTEGEAVRDDGAIVATASGKYIEADDALRERLLDSID